MSPQEAARQNVIQALGQLALQTIEQQAQIASLAAQIKALESARLTEDTKRDEAQHVDERRP